MTRLTTGLPALDRQLDGGIPSGSIVLLSAPPASQSELFLYSFTADRRTLYLSAIRSSEAVADGLARANVRAGDPEIRELGGDTPLDRANKLVGTLPEESTLIVDPIDPLERQEPGRYRYFLESLQMHLRNTESVAIIHAMAGRSVPELRDHTEHVADAVFDLRTEVVGNEVVNRLAIPKFRGGRAPDETIKLELTDGLAIDTSRDIA